MRNAGGRAGDDQTGRTIMDDGDFGYYDYSSASIEANGYANDAWASDDSAGYDYWSTRPPTPGTPVSMSTSAVGTQSATTARTRITTATRPLSMAWQPPGCHAIDGV
jgi:hypothetical protein